MQRSVELEADLRRLVSDGSVQAGGVTDREGAGEGDSSGPDVVQVGRVQEQSVGVQDVGAVALKQTERETIFLILLWSHDKIKSPDSDMMADTETQK